MLNWLWERLEKEGKAIKAAPIHFIFACLIGAIIIGLLWYAVFSTALGLQKSTIEAYKERFGDSNSPEKPNPKQWYLKIDSIEYEKFTNDSPPFLNRFGIVAIVNGLNYSFPISQLEYTRVATSIESGEFIGMPTKNEYAIQFAKKDFRKAYSPTNSLTDSNVVHTVSEKIDFYKTNDLPSKRTNAIAISTPIKDESVGKLKIIYEITSTP